MKWSLSLIVMCFLVAAENAMAVDLWNGFTSNMTEEEVLLKASAILEYQQEPIISNKVGDNTLSGINYDIPDCKRIELHSLKNAFNQDGNNITFYFYNNQLFMVHIWWAAKPTDVINSFKKQFGNKFETIIGTYPFFEYQYSVYKWSLQEKDCFLEDSSSYFVDRQARQNYVSDKIKAEENREIEENKKNSEATNAIVF